MPWRRAMGAWCVTVKLLFLGGWILHNAGSGLTAGAAAIVLAYRLGLILVTLYTT